LEDAEIPREQIFRALNCALVTWRTNRTISNKDPVAYLKERADSSLLTRSDPVVFGRSDPLLEQD
jgi:hypothetical protein